jgi:phage tail sheath gpL-like
VANTIISISHPSPWNRNAQGAARRRNEVIQSLITFMKAIMVGTKNGTTVTINSGTATTALAPAVGTITLSAGSSGTFTATINGVAITVTYATSLANTAALLAAAINASTNALVQYLVAAASISGTVTITALQPGITGNTITLAASSSAGTATASGARLTGGAGGSNLPYVAIC